MTDTVIGTIDTSASVCDVDAEGNAPLGSGSLWLCCLSTELLKSVLCYVIPVSATVSPWFNCGISTLGDRGFGLDDEHITFKPNIDTSFLRINKNCYRFGTDILYGSNHFCFTERPDCCKWWLNRIGDHNIRKIKRMTFILNSGWRYDRTDRYLLPSPSEQSFEEEWFNALQHVQRCQVGLEYLNLKFKHWADLRCKSGYEEEDKEELEKYRKMLVDQLTKFRAVKKVRLEELGPSYIGWEISRLELLMQQPWSTLKSAPAQNVLNLDQLIEQCNREDEIKMKRIMEGG